MTFRHESHNEDRPLICNLSLLTSIYLLIIRYWLHFKKKKLSYVKCPCFFLEEYFQEAISPKLFIRPFQCIKGNKLPRILATTTKRIKIPRTNQSRKFPSKNNKKSMKILRRGSNVSVLLKITPYLKLAECFGNLVSRFRNETWHDGAV